MVCLQGEETEEEKNKNQYLSLYPQNVHWIHVDKAKKAIPLNPSIQSANIPKPLQDKCKEQRMNHICSFSAPYSEHEPAWPTSLVTPLPFLPCSSCTFEFSWQYSFMYIYTYIYIYILCPIACHNGFSPSQKTAIPKAALHKKVHHHLCILLKCYYMVFPFWTSVVRLIKSVYQLMQITDWIKLAKI